VISRGHAVNSDRQFQTGCSDLLTARCGVPAKTLSQGHHVALHVVIGRKNVADLDGAGSSFRNFDLKPIVSDISGRYVAEFATVRPRVQIPGPRPFSYSISTISNVVWESAAHRRITISCRETKPGLCHCVCRGQCQITRLGSLGRQRPKPADARGRTVRHPVRTSHAVRLPTPVHPQHRGFQRTRGCG